MLCYYETNGGPMADHGLRIFAWLLTTRYLLTLCLSGFQARVQQRVPGQGMVEYGLIIAAVAIAVIVALFALGPKIGSMFSRTAASLK
jgi:pilus assembly protein Flp/PilA